MPKQRHSGHAGGPHAQEAPKDVFSENTRQRIQSAGPAIALSLVSNAAPLTLPRVGLLSKMYIYVSGFYTASGAGTVAYDNRGPWNLIKRFTTQINLGLNAINDVSGFGLHLINRITGIDIVTGCPLPSNGNGEQGYTTGNNGQTDPFFQAPTTISGTTGNNPIAWVYELPIAVNDGPEFDIGLINLQSPEIQVTLQLVGGALSDILSTISTATGISGVTAQVWYQYYEIPDPAHVELPKRVMHRILEDFTNILGVGDTYYTIPRMGILLQLLHYVVLNGTYDASVTDVTGRRLVFDITDTAYNTAWIVDRIQNRFRYGHLELGAGVYGWDFFIDSILPTSGGMRDAVDTEALANFWSYITLASTATLGANNNTMNNVRRISQEY